MDLVEIEGEDKPKMIFKPYIWAVIKEYSNCVTFERNRKIKVFMKEEYKYGKGHFTVKY